MLSFPAIVLPAPGSGGVLRAAVEEGQQYGELAAAALAGAASFDDAVMQVERVDFVSFLTEDIQRAKRFYTEVLGLEVVSEGESDMELTCGQVTLDVFDPSSIGQPFASSTQYRSW